MADVKDRDPAGLLRRAYEQDPVELLRRAIMESGMSIRKYARIVLIRDESTLRRWLKRQSPMPKAVIEFLQERYWP